MAGARVAKDEVAELKEAPIKHLCLPQTAGLEPIFTYYYNRQGITGRKSTDEDARGDSYKHSLAGHGSGSLRKMRSG